VQTLVTVHFHRLTPGIYSPDKVIYIGSCIDARRCNKPKFNWIGLRLAP